MGSAAKLACAARPNRVLLIEHEEADVELTLRALRNNWADLHVDVLSSPSELERSEPHSYDVVLSDYRLPGWNGMEAFRSLKDRGVEAPFILITGTIGEERAVDCIKEGIADYVLKDKLVKLPVAVERALQEYATRQERSRALQELRWAHDQLENRVAERTAELSAANRALREEAAAQARLVAILQATRDFVATANLDGSLLFLNSSGRDLTGIDLHNDVSNLRLPELCPGWQPQPALDTPGGEPDAWNGESSLRRRDGLEIPVLTMTVLHRDPQGNPAFISLVAHDITQRKEVERMKDELVATVSHELRTPLASLRGFSELMLKREFNQEKRREFLSIIQKETIRLSELINNFLDLQKMEWGRQTYELANVELASLLRESFALFEGGNERHHFVLEIDPQMRAVVADASRLRQVLSNLLANAIKYSPQGGEIRIYARVDGSDAIVSISDSGIGIPADAMPFLFSKFFRVHNGPHREIGGTGLGLSLVKQIILAHRGRVWAESVP